MTSQHEVHETHAHTHAGDCGHAAVEHGDHLDYLHEGHAHRREGSDWVECGPGDASHVAHDAHDHEHSETCGHDAVSHGNHLDYVHDEHRHALHDDHWDEH